jgi:hypothetical protein
MSLAVGCDIKVSTGPIMSRRQETTSVSWAESSGTELASWILTCATWMVCNGVRAVPYFACARSVGSGDINSAVPTLRGRSQEAWMIP